jgi:hypothetical protein
MTKLIEEFSANGLVDTHCHLKYGFEGINFIVVGPLLSWFWLVGLLV